MLYKYSQLTGRLTYAESQKIRKESKGREIPHVGQIKLLYSEILYLTKCAKEGNKVLYIGAAQGVHIPMLADMFPTLSFDLWDPGKFRFEYRKQIRVFNKFFTDEEARKYVAEGKNILFISDIRNLAIAKCTGENSFKDMDKIIVEDMNKQMNWVKIIQPRYCYLKFRLPYQAGSMPYFGGTIYLQTYSPPSTELRLLTNDYSNMVNYDNSECDEKMAYFNTFLRLEKGIQSARWMKVLKEIDLRVIWDNIYALHILDYYLRKMKGIKSDEEVTKLFNKIIEFQKKSKSNMAKYNIIYNNNKFKGKK